MNRYIVIEKGLGVLSSNIRELTEEHQPNATKQFIHFQMQKTELIVNMRQARKIGSLRARNGACKTGIPDPC